MLQPGRTVVLPPDAPSRWTDALTALRRDTATRDAVLSLPLLGELADFPLDLLVCGAVEDRRLDTEG